MYSFKTAEDILTSHAAEYPDQAQGLYVIRTSSKVTGAIVISLWSQRRVYHYQVFIEKCGRL